MQRVTVLCSAAHGTGLYANIPSVLSFSPLKTLATAHLVASVRDAAVRLIHAPTTPPLARKQYAIEREWLAERALVVVERSSRSPQPTWHPRLEAWEPRVYGETTMWFAELAQDDAPEPDDVQAVVATLDQVVPEIVVTGTPEDIAKVTS